MASSSHIKVFSLDFQTVSRQEAGTEKKEKVKVTRE